MKIFSQWIMKRALLVVIISFVTAAVGAYYSVKLYQNLRAEIEELLPTTTRSVIDLNEVTKRVESIDYMAVLIFSKDKKNLRRFVDDLAKQLETHPRSIISAVEYKVDREIDFFKSRQALYVELEDLKKLHKYIDDSIKYDKELYNPLNILPISDRMEKPTLDTEALKTKYKSKSTHFLHFPNGYYALPDESVYTLLVHLPGKLAGVKKAHELKNAIQSSIDHLNPGSYANDLDIRFAGSVEDLLEEHAALIEDLELSTIVVTILVTLALIVYFRNLPMISALLISLFVGTFWTFGIAYWWVGYLNANSAFLGSIVIGNGINFGIIFLARYLEERRLSKSHAESLPLSLYTTGKSTWTAALAAGLAYGSLLLTSFRGFKQFGLIGLIGMVLCWISAFTVCPALLTLFDRWNWIRVNKNTPAIIFGRIANLIQHYSKPIAYLSIGLVFFSFFWIGLNRHWEVIETDLSKLGSEKSQRNGSVFYGKYLNEIFKRHLSPIVILTESRDEATRLSQKLKNKKENEGEESLIAQVYSFDDFLPRNQEEKITLLKKIKTILTPQIRKELSRDYQDYIKELLNEKAFKVIEISDLSPLILRKFTEKDGRIGHAVLVEPPMNNSTWKSDRVIHFIREIRDIADEVRKNTPVVGLLPITSDMNLSIKRDGPIATLIALVSVVILVLILFRNIKDSSWVLLGLLLGIVWLAGLVYLFQIRINFLNFIALPITFGIGIDYAVNVYSRYRLDGRKSILNAIQNTGGAVGLASLTTIIGYGSLIIASNQAFVSFGTLAILGEFTCLIGATLSLPAIMNLKNIKTNHDQCSLNRSRDTYLENSSG